MHKACVDCKYFMRHRKVVRGPYWSDDLMEVDDIGGDCRRHPPTVSFWGTRYPYMLTGQWCGEYEAGEKDGTKR
jgi:hypothetical protein